MVRIADDQLFKVDDIGNEEKIDAKEDDEGDVDRTPG
jgi:hypothetical protein